MLGQNKTELNKPLNHEYKTAYDRGYNKAIDDLVQKAELKFYGVHPDEMLDKFYRSEIIECIKDIAKELKEKTE